MISNIFRNRFVNGTLAAGALLAGSLALAPAPASASEVVGNVQYGSLSEQFVNTSGLGLAGNQWGAAQTSSFTGATFGNVGGVSSTTASLPFGLGSSTQTDTYSGGGAFGLSADYAAAATGANIGVWTQEFGSGGVNETGLGFSYFGQN